MSMPMTGSASGGNTKILDDRLLKSQNAEDIRSDQTEKLKGRDYREVKVISVSPGPRRCPSGHRASGMSRRRPPIGHASLLHCSPQAGRHVTVTHSFTLLSDMKSTHSFFYISPL
ncbi:hypothetical protein JZ751_005609 [Albula glossodonta]|uniref:Uncharacterized protein n=1 Tax=Albula glossodonta TaxID=121402 RepID=A0A8T2NFB0_9TELE|nr:hypothetical protein JZ751_005609 [Albula glossodonta]